MESVVTQVIIYYTIRRRSVSLCDTLGWQLQKYVVEWGREKYYDTYPVGYSIPFGVYVELGYFSCRSPILWSYVVAYRTLLPLRRYSVLRFRRATLRNDRYAGVYGVGFAMERSVAAL